MERERLMSSGNVGRLRRSQIPRSPLLGGMLRSVKAKHMKSRSKLYEVVKTFEVSPIATRDGSQESFKFRIEILRGLAGRCAFFGRIYRRETFRLQPTFPQKDGVPSDMSGDHEVIVKDDVIDSGGITGDGVDAVLRRALEAIEEMFGPPRRRRNH